MPSTEAISYKIMTTGYADSNGYGSLSYGATDMAMCVSTGVSFVNSDWGMSSDVVAYAPEPAPEEDFEFCNWCAAEWFASKFYPGNCIACGGPRKFTYTRRTFA